MRISTNCLAPALARQRFTGNPSFSKSCRSFPSRNRPFAKSNHPWTQSSRPWRESNRSWTQSSRPWRESNRSWTQSSRSFANSSRYFPSGNRHFPAFFRQNHHFSADFADFTDFRPGKLPPSAKISEICGFGGRRPDEGESSIIHPPSAILAPISVSQNIMK